MINFYVYGSSPTLQELCIQSTSALGPLLWSTAGNLAALFFVIIAALLCLTALVSGAIFSLELTRRGSKKLIKEFFKNGE